MALSTRERLDLLGKARVLMGELPGRRRDSRGRPGGLVELGASRSPLIVGDLHGCVPALEAILADSGNRGELEAGRALLLFLGDAFHDDRPERLEDMASSLAILDALLALIARLPGAVCWLRGNHDGFDPQVTKGGVHQGALFREAALDAGGPELVSAMEALFEALPYVAVGEDFVAAHAGPPRGGATREELVEIARDPDLAVQLLWGRHEGGPGRWFFASYGEDDLVAMRAGLGLPESAEFIVGHTPLWGSGDSRGLWLDVFGSSHHHIVFSGWRSSAPYLKREGGRLVARYALPEGL